MKQVFIETKYHGDLVLPEKIISKLPERLILALPVQFIDFRDLIKSQLENSCKKVTLFQSQHGKYLGQILGCDTYSLQKDFDAFLYVGDGKFHPTALLYRNQKPVYCYNPFTEKLGVLDKKILEKLDQQKKGLLAKFFNSHKIGVLVSTKSGQNQQKIAEELRSRLEKFGKEVFVFSADEINFPSLENFNFVEVWINTSCPRIIEDFKCLNWKDLSDFFRR